MLKKIYCGALALCLAFALCQADFAQDTALRFGADGTFRILIIADTQDSDKPQAAMLALEEAALDAAAYDLVIFLGDQVHGPAIGNDVPATLAAIDAIVQPVVERGLPFAVVFGNHDDEGGVAKELQMAHYRSYTNCLAVEGEEMTGCGNYTLTIQNSAGEDAVCLWFFDSNSYDKTGASQYDWVHEDQLAWFAAETQRQKEANGGEALPGYVFQHIIVPEIYDILTPTGKSTAGAVQGHGAFSDAWYTLNDTHFTAGALGEGPCPPDYNGGEFAAWQENGAIAAAFFGHDHVNSFAGEKDGIGLIACPGSTYYIYGAPGAHGVRTVTLHEDTPTQWETQTLFYADLLGDGEPAGITATLGAYAYVLAARIGIPVLLALAALITGAVLLMRRRKRKKTAAATSAEQLGKQLVP